MIDGKAVFSAIEKDKHTEEEYESLVREYNELVREHYRLKAVCRDLLNENIRIVDELNKITGTEDDGK